MLILQISKEITYWKKNIFCARFNSRYTTEHSEYVKYNFPNVPYALKVCQQMTILQSPHVFKIFFTPPSWWTNANFWAAVPYSSPHLNARFFVGPPSFCPYRPIFICIWKDFNPTDEKYRKDSKAKWFLCEL